MASRPTLPRLNSCPAATMGSSRSLRSPPEATSKSRKKSSHVRVVARIRPLSSVEQKRGNTECVFPHEREEIDQLEDGSSVPFALSPSGSSSPETPSSGGVLCGTPKMGNAVTQDSVKDEAGYEHPSSNGESNDKISSTDKPIAKSLTAGTAKKKQFDYDAVFGASASQKEVYDQSVGDAVRRNLFKGYNTTIIAYGQTGSGKTYTMDGPAPAEATIDEDAEMISPNARPFRSPTYYSPKKKGRKSTAASRRPIKRSSLGLGGDDTLFSLSEDDGIVPRAMHDLFEAKQKQSRKCSISIHLTFMEIYNDEIRDLLAEDDTTENLTLRDNGDRGVIIKGMSSIEVQSPLQARELMDVASERRTTASTRANARSSRSHAICVLNVTINQRGIKRRAKLTLVDLAGSERLKQTGAEGLQQQEGIQINRDLFVLAKVVSALADRSKQGRRSSVTHIPYRDCKLTRILRDSLGGNCCTVMVACISPANSNLEETINTLRYAERTKAITNTVKQNVVKDTTGSAEMRRENKMLKAQIFALLEQVKELQSAKEAESGGLEKIAPTQDIFLETFQLNDDDDDETLLTNCSLDDTVSCCDSSITSIGFDETSVGSIGEGMQRATAAAAEVAEKRELLERLEGDAVNFKEKIDYLKSQLSDVETNVNAAKSRRQQLDNEIEEMKASQKRIQTESTALTNQVRVLTCERTELLEEIEGYQELNALVTLLNDEQDARRHAEEELKKVKDEAATSSSEDLSSLRAKLAQSEEEIRKLQTEVMKAEVKSLAHENLVLKQKWEDKENEDSEALKLKAEVKALASENVVLRKRLGGKENNKTIENREVLAERSANIDAAPMLKKPVKGNRDQSFVKDDPVFDTDSESVRSEQRAVRIHAAKMLFYATKSVEREGILSSHISACSSIASKESSESGAVRVPTDVSLSSKKSKKKKIGLGKLRKRLSRKNKLPPKPLSGGVVAVTEASDIASAKEVIGGAYNTNHVNAEADTGSAVKYNMSCTCSSQMFTKNAEEMDFYLPKLTMDCTCGKGAKEEQCIVGDPLDLDNFLRPWQIDFLATVRVTSAEELIWAQANDAHRISRAMKNWRELEQMKPVTRKACAIALHVWTKTAKVIKKSATDQKAMGCETLTKPNFLDVSYASNASSISTIGCGSAQSLTAY